MESSFFEYRDNTDVADNSGSEIENSLMDESFAPKKTPAKKNHTIVIPESDDTGTDGESDEDVSKYKSKQSDINIICSSDDDNMHHKKNLAGFVSPKKLILSSSEDEESLPVVDLSKRASSQSSASFIGRKNKKRIMQLDSDTDNSIIIEHNRHKKVVCLKSTPAKINDKKLLKQNLDMSYESNDSDQSDTENDSDFSDSKLDLTHDNDSYINNKDDKNDKYNDKSNDLDNISLDLKNKCNNSAVYESEEIEDDSLKDKQRNSDLYDSEDKDSNTKYRHKSSVNCIENNTNGIDDLNLTNKCESIVYDSDNDRRHSNNEQKDDENNSDGTEEYEVETKDCSDENEDDNNDDQMFMSRATRMSIMGIVPKENDSDDSDYIESDDSTRPGSSTSNPELPDSGLNISQTKQQIEENADTSRITCSPFSSPLRDITNKASPKNDSFHSGNSDSAVVDLTQMVDPDDLKSQIQRKLKSDVKENVIDDEVTIIDTKPEVIALSSDSEDDELKVEKSPTIKRSPKKERDGDTSSHRVGSDIKQYLVPASYPNQVLYVKKHVRENELNKLNGLKEDLQNVRYLLETMDLDTLPDGGNKLIERLTILENEVRRQGDKVANMVVDTEEPPSASLSKEDNEKGLSWDDIQKASNAVQPRMFGKQALTSHMAERNMILERLRDLYESLASRPPESALAPQPRAVVSALMPHQLHALAWLRWRETQRPGGGILADDMGLGKTITMISLIATDKENNLDRDDDDDDDDEDEHKYRSAKLVRGGTLVVCPASLMQQWAGEVGRHCAAHALAVCLHHGAQRATHALRLAPHDLVLTTYNILQRESEKGGVLTRIQWRRVILDEAHAVRNHKSQTSVAVSALRSRRRWALTGTPLHNKDLDLFALLKFLRCSPFDELSMWKKWIDNKSMGGQERLSTIMRCIMLRRTKQQLQQRGQLQCLPERSAHQCDVTLSKDEMNVYQKVLVFSKTLFAQFLHQRAEKQEDVMGHAPRAPERDSAYAKMHKKMIALHGAKPVKSHEILVLLLRLRQVCCHCGLIAAMLEADDAGELHEDPAGQDLLAELNKLSLDDSRNKRKSEGGRESDNEEESGEGTSVAEAIRSVLSPNNPVFQLQRRSSKIAAVMDCLNENVLSNPGEKAVVVSQWTSVLRLVEHELKNANVECVTLSGSVPVPKRPPLIDALNDPKNKVRIMLLSLCAGGVGLNLCGANHLLLLDPHWNPQLEEQAQDRIYRVGQTRHVHIYRFMCLDTVEQSIRKLQQAKLDLAESVLTGAKHTAASKLTIEDLKVLFNMGPQHIADE